MDISEVPHIPEWVTTYLSSEGIESLYPPQAAAVKAGVTTGNSLVASIPTASGKTLIAQLAMLSAIDRGGKALYIVPLRALASEKRDAFGAFEEYGLSVGVSTGNYEESGEWLADKDIIVATSEKVDSLVRNDAPWIDNLDCVVADEVHLVDDPNRGPTLEVTLAKLRQVNQGIQIVALSATIGNAEELAEWLGAELIDSDWRPIELRTGVQYGRALHFDDGSQQEIDVSQHEKPTAAIVRDTLADSGSTLVFVNSRRNAEAAAARLATTTIDWLTQEEEEQLAEIANEIRSESDTDTSEDLATVVEAGAAFHHAGAAPLHKQLVESAFRDRLLKVVCATPTLAAGVNTPARRVVVRDWRRYDGTIGGMAPLSVLEVHQMMGRAGRPGLDPYGESLLLATSHDELDELFDRYIWADPEPVRSKLAAEPAMRSHLLATIAAGFANSRSALLSFLDQTLYAAQTSETGRLENVVTNTLSYLEANGFIEKDEGLFATNLGHTVSRLYLDPMSAAEIIDGLEHNPDPTALSLYHLIARTPDFYELYLRANEPEEYTMLAYDREDEFCGEMPSEFEDGRFEDWLAALKTARMLEDWAQELDEDQITERYGIGPGDIRGKVDTAEWLLGAAERLAGELNTGAVSSIRNAKQRVAHGVNEELIDLVQVRGVGRVRARQLYDAGITSRSELRTANKSTILGALHGRRKTAENILSAVGHENPSMDQVTADGSVSPKKDVSTSEGQADLGDF